MKWSFYNHPSINHTLLLINGSGSDKFSFTQAGSFGIGTISPQKKLHLSGSGDVEQWIEATDDGYASLTLLSNNKRWHWSKRPSSEQDALQLYYHDGSLWSVPYMTVSPSGNMGIGTSTPGNSLSIYRETDANLGIITNQASSESTVWFRINSIGRDGAVIYRNDGRLSFNLDSDNAGNVENNEYMTILAMGNVGIGTHTPDAKLAVKGDIHAEEVRVDLNVPAPDYVFESGYSLLSLSELEAYVKENKHLPEVPSAKEMQANGLNLKEMNLLLLKKVEELTIHLIEENKRFNAQQNQIALLQMELAELKKKLYEKN